MDHPAPLPPHPYTATGIPLNYDSTESSPRSRNAEQWDDPLPQVPGAKLRLMFSYGGHIIPRPHDKSLCYVGGETRIIGVDRHSSLADLCSRISHSFLSGRSFTLKYQLPNEDLDSLISVTTDEDLENMIEEYERTASPIKTSRLRLFLFLAKPETATSMGNLLEDAKSETWFVEALNGTDHIPRRVSDSATMDCLLTDVHGESCNDLEAQTKIDTLADHNKQITKNVHDCHSMPDSLVVKNNSSYDSSSSSPSMSNLPPIRVRVEDGGGVRVLLDQKVGIEEQFAQLTVAAATTEPTVTVNNTMAVSDEFSNRVWSDDDRSDPGAPVGFRKPPLPLPLTLQPVQHKAGAAVNLPSPDSVASDTSITSANSFSRAAYNQDPGIDATKDTNRTQANLNLKSDVSDQEYKVQVQHQDSAYMLPPQQQQYIHASTHYIPHTATGAMQVPSYYPMYAPPPSQQPQFHHQMDHQQYPVYIMPRAQQYMSTLQSNVADNIVVASNHPLALPSPAMVGMPAAYTESTRPTYPTKAENVVNHEMMAAANGYKTAAQENSSVVQIPINQYQQQYVAYSQMHNPSQSLPVASSGTANYGFEYSHPAHGQVYYMQHPAATAVPSQYQSMTPAAIASLSDASEHLAADNNIRTS